MKAKFEFNLPEDREEFEMYKDAGAMHCILHDLDCYFRSKYKHKEPPSEEARKEFEEIRDQFYSYLNERELF